MSVTFEMVVALLLAPVAGALVQMARVLWAERGSRIEDRDRLLAERDKTIELYRDRLLPSLEQLLQSNSKMAEVLEEVARHALGSPGGRT